MPWGALPMTCCASVGSFTHPASSCSAVEGRLTTSHHLRLKSGTLEKRNETTAMFSRQDLPVLLPKTPRPAGKEGKGEMLHFCVTANGVQ